MEHLPHSALLRFATAGRNSACAVRLPVGRGSTRVNGTHRAPLETLRKVTTAGDIWNVTATCHLRAIKGPCHARPQKGRPPLGHHPVEQAAPLDRTGKGNGDG
ncbi:hypothetical protein GCM10010346_65290 [Streptomyces chryseus]|uniref:Transposase n=1 Tax=Streptomyces chryseus TaxID=68186 RepID=A0ABQ3EJV2_9ACTN|nr:hypothetical protein GCM10010346_65290 [Streptomyces chryseus]